jgi:hypothetical protein
MRDTTGSWERRARKIRGIAPDQNRERRTRKIRSVAPGQNRARKTKDTVIKQRCRARNTAGVAPEQTRAREVKNGTIDLSLASKIEAQEEETDTTIVIGEVHHEGVDLLHLTLVLKEVTERKEKAKYIGQAEQGQGRQT